MTVYENDFGRRSSAQNTDLGNEDRFYCSDPIQIQSSTQGMLYKRDRNSRKATPVPRSAASCKH